MPGQYMRDDDSNFGAALGRRIAPGQLGGFWDDLYGIAGKVQQVATAGRAVTTGDARVTIVPTQQGLTNYVTENPGKIATPLLIAGGAVLAYILATSGRSRRRR